MAYVFCAMYGLGARMKAEAARRREELERQKDELRAIEEERAHKK